MDIRTGTIVEIYGDGENVLCKVQQLAADHTAEKPHFKADGTWFKPFYNPYSSICRRAHDGKRFCKTVTCSEIKEFFRIRNKFWFSGGNTHRCDDTSIRIIYDDHYNTKRK